MLAALLSVLGLGSLGALAWFVGPAALLGFGRAAVGSAAKLPRWVWIAAAVATLLAAGFVVHQHKAHAAIAAAEQRGEAKADASWNAKMARVAAHAQQVRKGVEQLGVSISNLERTRNEQARRDRAAVADALLVRGPGAAASNCRPVNYPIAASAPGGQGHSAAVANVAGPQVSAGDRANVSWTWLVQRAREHDELLDEVKTLLDNDDRQRAAWEQMRSAAQSKAPAK